MFRAESRVKEILMGWDQAVEKYQDYREEVEEAILKYEEIDRLYDGACYDLREAEERIDALEQEIKELRTALHSKKRE